MIFPSRFTQIPQIVLYKMRSMSAYLIIFLYVIHFWFCLTDPKLENSVLWKYGRPSTEVTPGSLFYSKPLKHLLVKCQVCVSSLSFSFYVSLCLSFSLSHLTILNLLPPSLPRYSCLPQNFIVHHISYTIENVGVYIHVHTIYRY